MPDFVELGTLGRKIDPTGPDIGVRFHRPQSERGIEKNKSPCGQSRERWYIFFPIVRVGV